MTTYIAGYSGGVKTEEQLLAWSQWQHLDPEMQRRVKALMDASIVAGRPVGIGSIWRSYQGALDLALSRHYLSTSANFCCRWDGKYYKLRDNQAHAAFPGLTYHEDTTPDIKALAIDFVGDLTFLKQNAAAYGLKEFSQVNGEPWHGQPTSVPTSKRYYIAADHHPLPVIQLPGQPAPAKTRVLAPTPVLRQETRTTQDFGQCRALQHHCNFWGWRDAYGQVLIVDGDFGPKTEQAVRVMQRAIGATSDGDYGRQSASMFQNFLDAMVALGG